MTNLPFVRDYLQKSAAKKEVLAELHTNPFGGYGLYHLMNDAGELSTDAKEELAPIIAKVERRMELREEDLTIELPLKYDPLTDEEHDTLTFAIANALKTFVAEFPKMDKRLRLAEITGINDLLERHMDDTACIHFEIELEKILDPIFTHAARKISFESLYQAQGGVYMELRDFKGSRRLFHDEYLKERRLRKKEFVRVKKVIRKGYVEVQRFNYSSFYTRRWHLSHISHRLPRDNSIAAAHHKEGEIYALPQLYRQPIANLIDLYLYHMQDKSYDTTKYQPLRNYPPVADKSPERD